MMKPNFASSIPVGIEIKMQNDQILKKTLEESVFIVSTKPVMESVLDVISLFGNQKKVIIKAKGKSISDAVSVALIITEKLMKENTEIFNIKVDSELIQELGQVKSTIEIILRKK